MMVMRELPHLTKFDDFFYLLNRCEFRHMWKVPDAVQKKCKTMREFAIM